MAGPTFSIVLPVYNQADHLREIVSGHLEALRDRSASFELLLVNNGCRDDSPQVSSELAGQHQEVRFLELEQGGWGRAVRAGLEASAGNMLCYSNSARTTPEMLNLMLIYAEAYPGVVLKANRRIREGVVRRAGSLLYNLECRMLFDLPIWDVNGTPKVFPREFAGLLELQRDDDLIDLEFAVACQRSDYPIIEVPLLATTRHGGSSTTNMRSALRMYWGALRMRRASARESS